MDNKWKVGGKAGRDLIQSYWVSHLEITEIDELEKLLDWHQENDRFSQSNIDNCIIEKFTEATEN